MSPTPSDELGRIEAALNRGVDKIEEQIKRVSRDVVSLRERIAAMEVKITVIQDISKHVGSVEERLREMEAARHENRGRDRVVAASAGIVGAGVVSLILRWVGSI